MTWAVSPTQVADWRLCVRKFLWKYVVGLRPPAGPGAELGNEYHALLEHILLGHTIIVKGARREVFDRLSPALEHFPAAYRCQTEEKVRFTFRGVEWQGKIDAFADGVVYDLKTTKDTKWIKTPTELATDPQAIIYSWAKGTRRVKFVYVLTQGAYRVRPVETDVVGPGPVWDLLAEDGQHILDAVAKAYHPLAVEPGPPEACQAFGGCPFRDKCTDLKRGLGLGTKRATSGHGLIKLGRQDHMGMKDMLKAKLEQSVQDGSKGVVEPGPGVVSGSVIIDTESGPMPLVTTPPVAINPPESVEAGPPPLPPPPKQPAAPKRGRPKKTSPGQAPAPEATTAPPAGDISASAGGTAVAGPMYDGKLSIRTLYVNCQSDSHPETVDLAKVMAEAHEYTREKCNTNHWLDLPFSEGKAAMATFALEILRQNPACAQGTLRVRCSSYMPETALVMGELQAAAAEVVR